MDIKILRLLIVDDSPDDADVIIATLRKAGYMLKSQRVKDMASMQTELGRANWDMVIGEYSMPHFGAQYALDLIKGSNLDIPFIIMTRKIDDTDLVQIMRNGACDVILKQQSTRLVPAIQRELRAARDRNIFHKQQQILKETEDKNRAIIEGSHEAVCYSHEGMHIDANQSYLDMFGYGNPDELEGIPILNLITKSEHSRFKGFMRKKAKNIDADVNNEFEVMKKDGSSFFVELNMSEIDHKGENCTQIIFTDISKRKAVEKKLQYLNQRDPLTGLYNRHYFLQELGKAIEKAKVGGNKSTLLFLDMAQLKKINETVGHAAGDRLLLLLAKMFREKLGEDAIISRFSGDEFAVLLADTDEEHGANAADDLQNTLKDTTFTEGGQTFHCNCTLGKTVVDEHAESTHAVLLQVYKSSASNKPAETLEAKIADTPISVKGHTLASNTSEKAEVDRKWRDRIQQALEQDSFQLAFQPIINLHGDPAELFEVLVRLENDQGELISAGEFLPTARLTGQIHEIDKWVIEHAVPTLAELHNEEKRATFFINLAPQSIADSGLPELITQTLQAHGVDGYHLVFEADESDLVDDPIAAGNFIRTIHEIGCQFCMDNFGMGFGNFSFLRHQAIEYVKITGTLIHDLQNDTINQAILQGLTLVTKALGKKAIAKFVEDAASLSMLWDLEIDYVQGNYFQQADSKINFDFSSDSGETTLSSDETTPNWVS